MLLHSVVLYALAVGSVQLALVGLDHAVVCHHAVHLYLHVGELGIDGGRESLVGLVVCQLAEVVAHGAVKLLRATYRGVAPSVALPEVAVDGILDASVLAVGSSLGLGGVGCRRSGIGMVVVDVAVAVVCPAGGLVDEARLVQLAHQVNVVLGVMLSAGLIEYHPVDDGGGVIVGVDHCRQLGSEHIGVVGHALVLGASVVHRRHILPHQQAELVGPIVPAARLHLEVLAHHVESVFLHLDDVVLYSLIAGRREVALRPVALVQRSGLEDELVVEHHAVVAVLVAAQAYLAHAEVALHLVLLAVVVQQLQLEVVEERVVGVPQVGILDAQHDVLSGLSLALCHLLRAVVGRCLQLGHIVGVAAGGGVDGQRLGINVGHHVEVFYIGGVNSLQPYRLPDAGACRVEDASRTAHLLAAGH